MSTVLIDKGGPEICNVCKLVSSKILHNSAEVHCVVIANEFIVMGRIGSQLRGVADRSKYAMYLSSFNFRQTSCSICSLAASSVFFRISAANTSFSFRSFSSRALRSDVLKPRSAASRAFCSVASFFPMMLASFFIICLTVKGCIVWWNSSSFFSLHPVTCLLSRRPIAFTEATPFFVTGKAYL